jgi:Suppressor of fused protein (SUFU)
VWKPTGGSGLFWLRYSPGMAGEDVLVAVEAQLAATYGADSTRASVSFVGVERIDVLRFGPRDGRTIRYATVGMSRRPMSEPSLEPAPDGPRAELVLTLSAPRDSVLRRLAVLAATPAVDGLVLSPDGTVELGEPLWDGSRCSAVLVEAPLGPAIEAGGATVELLPVTPITPAELAYRRVHGAAALRAAWLAGGTDLADPERRTVRLP